MISTERDNMEIPVIKEVTMQAIATAKMIPLTMYCRLTNFVIPTVTFLYFSTTRFDNSVKAL